MTLQQALIGKAHGTDRRVFSRASITLLDAVSTACTACSFSHSADKFRRTLVTTHQEKTQYDSLNTAARGFVGARMEAAVARTWRTWVADAAGLQCWPRLLGRPQQPIAPLRAVLGVLEPPVSFPKPLGSFAGRRIALPAWQNPKA
jgi:hypothetical protein